MLSCRPCSIVLLIVFCLSASSLHAEVLVGKIRSLEQAEGRFVIELMENKEQVTVQLAPDLLFERPNGLKHPGCVCPDNLVHVWGEYQKNGNVFLAEKIRGSRRHNDPTGVRARIGMGCRMHQRNERPGKGAGR